MANSIEVFRADDTTLTITFKDSAGTAIDITGYTVWFIVKERREDTDIEALINKTVTSHSDPTNGITTVDLTNSDTDIVADNLFYGIKWKDTSDDVLTIDDGDFKIKQGVVRKIV